LSTLAAGAAHELGTPLGTLAVVAEELGQARDLPPHLHNDVALMQRELERCRAIMRDLNVSSASLMASDVQQRQASVLLEDAARATGQRARIDLQLDADRALRLPLVPLQRALQNLLLNALAVDPGTITLRFAAVDERQVGFSVIDHGPGMPASVLERLGEPYFTTKPPGAGAGLGVYVAVRLAESLGGSLQVQSELGRGVTVCLLVPLSLAVPASSSALSVMSA
jgi:two-component system sensor histidine kinase RegB